MGLELGMSVDHHGTLEDPLQGQQVLLTTELSLQHTVTFSVVCFLCNLIQNMRSLSKINAQIKSFSSYRRTQYFSLYRLNSISLTLIFLISIHYTDWASYGSFMDENINCILCFSCIHPTVYSVAFLPRWYLSLPSQTPISSHFCCCFVFVDPVGLMGLESSTGS